MPDRDLTLLLREWGGGSQSAGEVLFPLIYQELRQLARYHSNAGRRNTVEPTALVHEAFLALLKDTKTDWRDRTQFYAFAGVVMRRLVVDAARRRKAAKRGGDAERIEFDDSLEVRAGGMDFEALDEALTRLAALDEQQARIVELRFFAGLTVEETAEHLGVSPRTVNREWGMAKVWLADQLRAER
ncbi:ECF-type sigma factor [Paludibaculum fermentans]|uniref:Sigma-70 family RNA polymerase sigma factor n=1 Tax=Paludibaculum fermentans TaxID=1473598 RepID=A0A7S7NNZ4_PALFE|nr:ECF-type sigma factor [Paludibaculum fermentans]QOY87132.1 sigma-70 family RNA polymerase sigma factor [Paludibaculum fermentans]